MTKHVWIAQCLCPKRHAIIATAGEADDATAEDKLLTPLRRKVVEMLADEAINPWCGLCKAKLETWRYELRRTRFATMREAEPEIRKSEAEQALTRAIWGDRP